jgi:hypothetical protein
MQLKPTIRKVLASSVPHGDAICTRGNYVWQAFNGDRWVCTAATAKEAREMYKRAAMCGTYGKAPTVFPSELECRRDAPHKLRPDEPV